VSDGDWAGSEGIPDDRFTPMSSVPAIVAGRDGCEDRAAHRSQRELSVLSGTPHISQRFKNSFPSLVSLLLSFVYMTRLLSKQPQRSF
jgi:hypothetical protein